MGNDWREQYLAEASEVISGTLYLVFHCQLFLGDARSVRLRNVYHFCKEIELPLYFLETIYICVT